MRNKIAIISILIGLSIFTMYSSKTNEQTTTEVKEKPQDPVIQIFNKSEANFEEMIIRGWIQVNNSFEEFDNLEKIARTIDNQSNISLEDLEKNIDETEHFRAITYEGKSQGYNVELYIQSIKGASESDTRDAETYVLITLTRDSIDTNYQETYQGLKRSLELLGPSSQIGLMLTGKIPNEIEEKNRENKILDLFKLVNAEPGETISYENFTSVTGYSPMINDELIVESEKINLNIAIRYNYLEEETHIVIGTPLILMDY